MTWLTIIIAVLSTSYFVFFRKRFDVFFIGQSATLVYFIPCFFGYDLYGLSLSPIIGISYLAITLSIILAAAIFDLKYEYSERNDSFRESANFLSNTSTILIAIHLLYLFIEYGPSKIIVPKQETTLSFFDVFLLRTIATISFLSSLVVKRKLSLVIASLALLTLLLSGDRTGIVMAVLGALLLILHGQRLSRRTALGALGGGALLIIFGVYGKAIYFFASRAIAGHRSSLIDVLLEFSSTDRFEPFVTQAIFNKIIYSGYSIDSSYLFNLPVVLLPSSRVFGVSSAHFNTEFQSALFPGQRIGSMAYNFWAEGYANFAEFGILIFILLYVSILFVFQLCLNSTRSTWVYVSLLIMSPYWAFYIHRNSLFSILSYEKQFFYLILIFFIAYSIRKSLASR